jgi:hypothetical protein
LFNEFVDVIDITELSPSSFALECKLMKEILDAFDVVLMRFIGDKSSSFVTTNDVLD